MYKTQFLLIFLLIGTPYTAPAQLNAHWRFGANAGVDFSSGSAVGVVGNCFAERSSAAASNANGNLLLYTNGSSVWDRTGNVMPSGTGLLGSTFATQTIIVPQPGNCDRFFIFTTTDENGDRKFRYTLVDLCLHGGLGNVVQGEKNIVLQTFTTESVVALTHANGRDLWVIVHAIVGPTYHAFLLNDQGINTTPVTSDAGSLPFPSNTEDQMEGAHSGTQLVHIAWGVCDLLNFDPTSGVVSSGRDLAAEFAFPTGGYDAVFSPDDSKIYVTTGGFTTVLRQLDLVTNTNTTLGTLPIESGGYGGIQLGPDGKVYVARRLRYYLDVIHAPNLPGAACGHVEQGLLMPRMCRYGLPSSLATDYVRSLAPAPKPDLGPDVTLCPGTLVNLFVEPTCSDTVLWSNGTQFAHTQVWAPDTVVVEIHAACGTGRDTLIVHAIPGIHNAPFVVPNVFTPNGDGINDIWQPDSGPEDRVAFTILDRWGKTVFETSGTLTYWDGQNTDRQGPVPDGIYYYICKVDRLGPCVSRTDQMHGHVTLLR